MSNNMNTDGELLIDASRDGDLATVQRLLSSQGVDVNYKNSGGVTALMWASHYGHIEVIKALLQQNANIDIQGYDGWTALMRASCNGRIDCVRLLLDKGANVNLKTKRGETAKDMAQQYGYLEIVTLLTEVSIIYVHANLSSAYFTHWTCCCMISL